MTRRGISGESVRQVMRAPGQRLPVRPGRVVLQSQLSDMIAGTVMLVRVFVDVDRVPPEVVTVSATSKIARYWEIGHEG